MGFRANIGNMWVDGDETRIFDISLILETEKSYIEFTNGNTIFEERNFNNYDNKKILIQFQSNSYIICLEKVCITTINCGIESGIHPTKIKMVATFVNFTIKKGNIDDIAKYRARFYISKIDFKRGWLNSVLKRTFSLNIENKQIGYIFDNKTNNGYFEFPNSMSKNECKDIFAILQELFAVYSGKKFKLDYVLIKDETHEEFFGNINEGYIFYNEGYVQYDFIDTRRTSYKEFIESVFDNYKRKNKNWRLNLLIDYFLQYYHSQFVEIQFLCFSIFFEALKYSYAENIRHFKRDKNQFFLKPNTKERYSFKEILNLIYGELNIHNGTTSFISKRDCLIHTGEIANVNIKEIFELKNQIKEIIVSLLNFQGEVHFRDIVTYKDINTTFSEYQKSKG
ncbi:MAG: hypothetical protein LBV16_08045 [Elusimicrobiota bacterium]|nr:hypothetical protein [Elusimicrobiota bacterium]